MPTVTSKDGAKITYDVKGKGPALGYNECERLQ